MINYFRFTKTNYNINMKVNKLNLLIQRLFYEVHT
jgi:hypothetical protein